MQKLNIAMVCDYFYPNTGGIENHILLLSNELIKLGNKVVVITHSYKNYTGIRFIGPLKVYYLNVPLVAANTSFPSLFSNFWEFKKIFDDENIGLVHGHQSMSNLCLEAIFHAATMNIKSVITEHSVFEIGGFENIIMNNLNQLILKTIDACICVSYTCKENMHHRTEIPPEKIFVIPNAVINSDFFPDKESVIKRRISRKDINIVMVSRLVYRKGVDLLIGAIPLICELDNRIKIIIGGDGPKRDEIEQLIDELCLKDRVKVLGNVDYKNVPSILRSGDIFLNTSLTESFCMAILEAASCGLRVVSTNVGGVYEVLPPYMIDLVCPTKDDIVRGIQKAIKKIDNHDPMEFHNTIKEIYTWSRIAVETEKVYASIPKPKNSLLTRLSKYNKWNDFLFRLTIVIDYLLLCVISFF